MPKRILLLSAVVFRPAVLDNSAPGRLSASTVGRPAPQYAHSYTVLLEKKQQETGPLLRPHQHRLRRRPCIPISRSPFDTFSHTLRYGLFLVARAGYGRDGAKATEQEQTGAQRHLGMTKLAPVAPPPPRCCVRERDGSMRLVGSFLMVHLYVTRGRSGEQRCLPRCPIVIGTCRRAYWRGIGSVRPRVADVLQRQMSGLDG